jgi:hypothetical protein
VTTRICALVYLFCNDSEYSAPLACEKCPTQHFNVVFYGPHTRFHTVLVLIVAIFDSVSLPYRFLPALDEKAVRKLPNSRERINFPGTVRSTARHSTFALLRRLDYHRCRPAARASDAGYVDIVGWVSDLKLHRSSRTHPLTRSLVSAVKRFTLDGHGRTRGCVFPPQKRDRTSMPSLSLP